jgi:hypothetical protein
LGSGLFSRIFGVDNANPISSTNPLPTIPGTQTIANGTSVTASIPGSSTTVTLTAASTNILITTSPGAAILYVNPWGGAATASNFAIQPGSSMSFTCLPITSFTIFGATATGTYSVLAH